MKAWISILTLLLLVGCVSPIERRVTRNPEMFNKLTPSEQAMVRRGEIREGMTRDAVYLAMGRPARVFRGKRDGKELERWSYNAYEAVYTSSFGFGGWYGSGGHCGHYAPYYWGGPQIDYVPVEGSFVEFIGGKVSGFAMRW